MLRPWTRYASDGPRCLEADPHIPVRFGFDAWLQPYTDQTMESWRKEGLRRCRAVVMPGFSADV